MDSLNALLTVSLSGRAMGVTANANLQTPVQLGTALALDLASTSSGAALANSAFGTGHTRTLTAGSNEELDIFNFSSVLNESGSSMVKARIFYIYHLPTSVASSITWGNPSGNPFLPFGIGATQTETLKPGEATIKLSPTTAGMTVSNTAKTVKVLNNDGSNAATYEIGVIGATS